MDIKIEFVIQIDSTYSYACKENRIGVRGAKALGEALKYNTSLIELNLSCMNQSMLVIL